MPIPIVLIWEITYRCNMKCNFCNIWRFEPKYYKDELTTEEGIALVSEAGDLGAGLLYLTGGEPLLRKDIGEILRAAKQKKMITMMASNGFLIEDEIGQIKNLDYLRVSIDSLKRHDNIRGCSLALTRAVAGIERAKMYGLDVIINATINSETISEMEDLAKFAERLNCKITLSPFIIISKGMKDERDGSRLLPDYKTYAAGVRKLKRKYSCIVNNDHYLDLVEKGGIGYSDFTCKASDNILSVTPQGDVCFPCNVYPIKKLNVRKTGNLRRIWYSESANGIRKEMKKYDFCTSCINRCYLLPSISFSTKGLLEGVSKLVRRRDIF